MVALPAVQEPARARARLPQAPERRRAAANAPRADGTNVNVASWCVISAKRFRDRLQASASGKTSVACTSESPFA